MALDYGDMNLFMVCPKPVQAKTAELPEGFSFDLCRRDELGLWKDIHFDKPETAAAYRGMMDEYFQKVYADREDEFFSRCLFVRNEKGEPVATGFIWNSYHRIHTLHWFKVKLEYENRGIGRALLTRMMGALTEADYPVCLHTQPTSYRAMKLYTDFGFRVITDAAVGQKKNHLRESLQYLRENMTQTAWSNLQFSAAPAEFLEAAASSEISEF